MSLPPAYTSRHEGHNAPTSSPPTTLNVEEDRPPPAYLPDVNEEVTPETADPPSYPGRQVLEAFALHKPFIFATHNSYAARYHVDLVVSRTGRPWHLRLRKLGPAESRRISRPQAATGGLANTDGTNTLGAGGNEPRPRKQEVKDIEFPEDSTLYVADLCGLMANAALTMKALRAKSAEITGRKPRTLPGKITIEMKKGSAAAALPALGMGRSFKFWHMTRKVGSAGRPGADASFGQVGKELEKNGYRPEEEWRSELLFIASSRGFASLASGRSRYDWEDAGGIGLAEENGERLTMKHEVGEQTRDALLMCWVTKAWVLSEFGF